MLKIFLLFFGLRRRSPSVCRNDSDMTLKYIAADITLVPAALLPARKAEALLNSTNLGADSRNKMKVSDPVWIYYQ
ncbi:hypothetical protein [Bacillus sp. V5-8f]|uniref:hypothetical protein n=1 Tax=Bacillus sp. V5-8f TaxID=2053044 RepID=UPI000C760488|nr:hypothetical protein [Bacillus sp. V5-8f]PLT34761.1 hypothetical protein CUU64_04970 [Bacillus sp. V5-8f]